MRTQKLQGLIAAPFSPLNDVGVLNLDIIPNYYHFLKRNGIIGVFVNGTSGEGYSLTINERKLIAQSWVEITNAQNEGSKDFRIIIQVGNTCFKNEVELAKHALQIGADGYSTMAPIFFKPSSLSSLIEYIRSICSAAPSIPYYYYHIPQISGVKFPMLELLKYIHEHKDEGFQNFEGIKYSDPDFGDYNLCQTEFGEDYDMPFCSDQVLISAMSMGAQSSIGSTYNYAAPLSISIMEEFSKGNYKKAQDLEYLLMRTVQILASSGSYFSGSKYIVKKNGDLDLGQVLTPLKNLSDKELKNLNEQLQSLGIEKYLSK